MFLNFYPSSLFYFELTPVTGGGNGNPLQYSCLENSVDRAAWRATVHKVTKSWTQLKQLSTPKGF